MNVDIENVDNVDIENTIVLGKRLVIRNKKASAPPDEGLQKRLWRQLYKLKTNFQLIGLSPEDKTKYDKHKRF